MTGADTPSITVRQYGDAASIRSLIAHQPHNQEFLLCWKGKYIVGITNVPAEAHYNVRYEYDNGAVIAHDFFANDPYPGVLTIEASESSDPTPAADFETALRAFLQTVGVSNVSMSHVTQLSWWNTNAAYYFTPFAAVDDQGNNVTIVDQGANIYDGAQDSNFLTFVDSNGTRYAARAFKSNVASYLCIDELNRYQLYEPEESAILELGTIDAWEVYPNTVLSQGLVDYIHARYSESYLFREAWGFGDGDNGELCVVDSSRTATPLVMTGIGDEPCTMHLDLGTDFSANVATFVGTALACPIDIPDLLGLGVSEEAVNVVVSRISCNVGNRDGVLRFHSPDNAFPDATVSYQYSEETQESWWRLQFVGP